MKRNIIKLIFALFLLPMASFAQFTGFQDETVSGPTVWTADDNVLGSDGTEITNSNENFSAEGDYSNSASVNINTAGGNNTCRVETKTLNGYVDFIGCAVRVAILPFIFALAVVGFVFGVTTMISQPDNAEAQSKGRTFILWGIIGFFVITSVYALVAIIRRTVGFGSNFGGENSGTPYVQLKEKVQKLK